MLIFKIFLFILDPRFTTESLYEKVAVYLPVMLNNPQCHGYNQTGNVIQSMFLRSILNNLTEVKRFKRSFSSSYQNLKTKISRLRLDNILIWNCNLILPWVALNMYFINQNNAMKPQFQHSFSTKGYHNWSKSFSITKHYSLKALFWDFLIVDLKCSLFL